MKGVFSFLKQIAATVPQTGILKKADLIINPAPLNQLTI